MKNDVVTYAQEDVGFYPTPPELVEKMISDIKWNEIRSILEPSAGKGNIVLGILEYLYDHRYSGGGQYYSTPFRDVEIDCVEIDPNLRGILDFNFTGKNVDEYKKILRNLRDKPYSDKIVADKMAEQEAEKYLKIFDSGRVRIVGSDFLNFITQKRYDLIIMNPPFDKGAEHLLRAIKLVEDGGGRIVCLLNAETLRNPYSNIRKVLKSKLEKYEADVSFLENSFTSAERKTNVDVAMIKIKIPGKKRDSLFFEGLRRAEEIKREKNPDQAIINSDPIQQMIDLYNFEVKGTLRLIDEYEAIKPYIMDKIPFGETDSEREESMRYSNALLTLKVCGDGDYGQSVDVSKYLKKVRAKYWASFFKNDQFTGQLTSNLRTEFESTVSEMSNYDFSIFNIQQVLDRIGKSLSRGVEETILATFDKLSEEHSWYPETAKNIRHYYSAWATNKAHCINKKVIIPIYGCFAYDSWYKKYDDVISVQNIYSVLSDIEKSLNYLDNCETEAVDLMSVLDAAKNRAVSKKIQCKYFMVTFFKKGTCHIEFTNERLLEKLNIFGSQKKKWLPPCYGKKHYTDMTEEEKAVVDDFQGKEEYEKVLADSEYFLVEQNMSGINLLLDAGGKKQ